MDSDTIILSDIDIIFKSSEYNRTGFILWPDMYGSDCYNRNVKFSSKTRGYTSFPLHILYNHSIGGLVHDNSYSYSQEAETGQFVINLNRHKGLVQLCLYYSEIQYLYALVNGDKDIFRLIFLMMGEPFTFVEYIPDISVAKNLKRDSLIHYWHYHEVNYHHSNTSSSNIAAIDKDNMQMVANRTPFFIHQFKFKDPEAIKNVYTIKGSRCAPTFFPLNLKNWKQVVLPRENYYEKLLRELVVTVDTDWRIITHFSIDRPMPYLRYLCVHSTALIGWFIDKMLN